MTPAKELVVIRTIENTNGSRRLVVAVTEIAAKWKVIRLTSYRLDDRGEWLRLGYVDVPPQFIDEFLPAVERAFDVIAGGRAA